MYLLNRLATLYGHDMQTYLHSTMYLLNRTSISSFIARIRSFTFHYVSIKSDIVDTDVVLFHHLHSTMYLLNRSMLCDSAQHN